MNSHRFWARLLRPSTPSLPTDVLPVRTPGAAISPSPIYDSLRVEYGMKELDAMTREPWSA